MLRLPQILQFLSTTTTQSVQLIRHMSSSQVGKQRIRYVGRSSNDFNFYTYDTLKLEVNFFKCDLGYIGCAPKDFMKTIIDEMNL